MMFMNLFIMFTEMNKNNVDATVQILKDCDYCNQHILHKNLV